MGQKRKFIWFTTKNRCKINMTMNIDITKLIEIIKERKIRCYPTFTYITSRIINENKEFKMSYDEEGNLGYYNLVNPRYQIFHETDKRISILWTEYSNNFYIFYNNFIEDIKKYGEKNKYDYKSKVSTELF